MICSYLYCGPQTLTTYFFPINKKLLETWNYGSLSLLRAEKNITKVVVLFGQYIVWS